MDNNYKIIKQFVGVVLLDENRTTIKPEKEQKLFLAEKDDIGYFIITDNNKTIIKSWNIGGIEYAAINNENKK